MISNYEEKLLNTQEEFKTLIDLVSHGWQYLEIHKVEENLFRKLMGIGLQLLELHITKRGTGKNQYQGKLPYHKDDDWNYISIFGKMDIPRAYFWEKENEDSIHPLDEILNLSEKHHSYLLQKWSQLIAVDSTYDKARNVLNEILQINIWSQQMEKINRDTGTYVDEFYENNPPEGESNPILVTEIDCKGVVMRKEEKKEKKVRLGKGEKPNTKKMSTVTAVFGIERNIRTVSDIVKQEAQEEKDDNNVKSFKVIKSSTKDTPKPVNKKVRATLKGKETAFERLAKEVELRDPDNKCERVALMDGERALERLTKKYLPGFIIILDLFHVMEKLWELCYFFCKEKSKESLEWVKKYLTMLLTGKVGYFIGAIKQMVTKGNFNKARKNKITKILNYFEKRKKYMRYDEYISKGYPIGSGVIEGTCRSFIKDRMELSGMRWTEEGAESMLELRSVKVNGCWNDFWENFISTKRNVIYANQDKKVA